jgi:hypothetical protein
VAHEEHARRLMETHGHPHLLQNEIALEIIARRGQRFRSTSDDDHVRPQNSLSPEKLVYRQTDALIEAAQHRGVGDIRLRRKPKWKIFCIGVPGKSTRFVPDLLNVNPLPETLHEHGDDEYNDADEHPD